MVVAQAPWVLASWPAAAWPAAAWPVAAWPAAAWPVAAWPAAAWPVAAWPAAAWPAWPAAASFARPVAWRAAASVKKSDDSVTSVARRSLTLSLESSYINCSSCQQNGKSID